MLKIKSKVSVSTILILVLFILLISSFTVSNPGNLVGNLTSAPVQFNVTEDVSCEKPPKIELSGGDSIFEPGMNITISALLTDRWNNPVDYWTYLNLSIYTGNYLVFNPTQMTKNTTGWYHLNYTIPSTASYGSYSVLVEGDPCGVVTKATTGYRVAILNVTLTNLNELVAYLKKINATTVSMNESLLAINASYMKYFSVWNATFYFWNNSYFVNWNSSIMSLQNNFTDIFNYFDCTGRGANNVLCTFIFEINATQKAYFPTWNTSFYTWNNSYFSIWNSTIIDLNKNFSDLWDYWDCTGAGANSLVCNYLDEINATTKEINITTHDMNASIGTLPEINKTVGYIWEKFQRVNASQYIHNETVLVAILNKTSNIKIWYNLTIPIKQGYTTEDYLPIRLKYWIINLKDTSDPNDDVCANQQRTFESATTPYCNPIIAQYVGKGSSLVNFNITLQPSLDIGNYSIAREVEIDPNNVWISYQFGTIGRFEVTEDVRDVVLEPKAETSGSEDGKWIYINKSSFEKFRLNVPIQSLVRLWGSVRDRGNRPLPLKSLKVEITDTFLPDVKWSETYDSAVRNGVFNIPLGAKVPLSLISEREYRLDITACNGKTFDVKKYLCDTFTTYINPV